MQIPADWRVWLAIAAVILIAVVLLICARYSVSLGWRGMKAMFSPPDQRRMRVKVGSNLTLKNSETGDISGIAGGTLPEQVDADVLAGASMSGSKTGDISGVVQTNRATRKG